jgi:hypothetical protein
MSVTLNQRSNGSTAPFDAALPYTTAAALGLFIGFVFAFPAPFRLGMPTVLLAAGLSRALHVHLTRERLRAQADVWLASIHSPSPSAFPWRVEELVGSERKVVGRTLRSIAEEVMRPYRRGAPTVNRSRLRPQADLLSEVAEALEDPERHASPRAIARTRLLITDVGSPLNCSARHDELHQTLTSILADISGPMSAENKAQGRRSRGPQRHDQTRSRVLPQTPAPVIGSPETPTAPSEAVPLRRWGTRPISLRVPDRDADGKRAKEQPVNRQTTCRLIERNAPLRMRP